MGFFKRILRKFKKNKRHTDDLADTARPYTPYPTYEEIQDHLKKVDGPATESQCYTNGIQYAAPRNSNLSIPTPLSPVVEAINENGSTRSVSDFGSLLGMFGFHDTPYYAERASQNLRMNLSQSQRLPIHNPISVPSLAFPKVEIPIE